MSTATNKGSQNVFFQYGDPLTGAEFGAKETKVSALGIYDGGLLSIVDNTSVTVSSWTAVITDGTTTVTARAGASYDVSGVSSTNRNIILRWSYNTRNDWYVDVLAVADGSVATNDLVVGRVVYSGAVITGFNYATRSVPMSLEHFLRVVPTVPASMRVVVKSGWCNYGTSRLFIATQLSSNFTPPVSNPRIDVIYVDSVGALQILTGTEAVSPTAPAYGGKIVLAEISLTVGMSAIATSNIVDARGIVFAASNANFVDLTTDQTIQGIKNFAGGIVIESRTSDPSSPATGRIWLRSDL
jgi:hypothetical protein